MTKKGKKYWALGTLKVDPFVLGNAKLFFWNAVAFMLLLFTNAKVPPPFFFETPFDTVALILRSLSGFLILSVFSFFFSLDFDFSFREVRFFFWRRLTLANAHKSHLPILPFFFSYTQALESANVEAVIVFRTLSIFVTAYGDFRLLQVRTLLVYEALSY